MFSENDLKQIKNLVKSFLNTKKYFPFVEDLMKEYQVIFPQDLSDEEKEQIENFINQLILDYLKSKHTKGSKILLNIFQRNDELWKQFRKLNNENNFNDSEFKKIWKQMEELIMKGEDQLTEKLVWSKSMGIQKASDAYYDLVYAVFPLWNKL